MNSLERRLARIEKQTDTGKKIFILDCWAGETPEDVKRRHYAEHPEDKDGALIIMWIWSKSGPEDAAARALERTRT